MRRALAFALLMLPSACGGIGHQPSLSGSHVVVGAMNAPLVLPTERTKPAVKAEASKTPKPSPVAHKAQPDAMAIDRKWGARVDYDHTIDRPDQLAGATRNQETSRPAFATVKRSFGNGEFRPYIGVGVGQASSKFSAVDSGTKDGYAVKGVLGGDLFFSENFGGYVQYDYAVASENPALADDKKSHGISMGLSLSLN